MRPSPSPVSDKRNPLIADLMRYRQRFPAEALCAEQFLSFVTEHPDCFERSLTIGHVTASSWILNLRCDAVILLHHGKLKRWMQPGGHADGESNVWEVAAREAREETGLETAMQPGPALTVPREIFDLDIHTIPARSDEPAHLHYDVRVVFFARDGFQPICSTESTEVRWIPLGDVSLLTEEPSILRMREKTETLLKQGYFSCA